MERKVVSIFARWKGKMETKMERMESKMESLEKHFPSADRSEWKENDPISFIDPASGETKTGRVIHAIAPIEQFGRVHPLQYLVDCGDGFPHVITSGDITA